MNQNLKKMISYYKLPGSFCGRHVICDTFCGSGTDYSTGCAVCDIDSDLSAAPDDAAETFF